LEIIMARKPRNSLSKGAIYQQLLMLEKKVDHTADEGFDTLMGPGPVETTSMETLTTRLMRAGAVCQLSRLYEAGLVSAENFLLVVVDVAKGE
jgi:hypothetical protein